MRRFQFNEWRYSGVDMTITVNEDYIRRTYWEYWKEQMKRRGLEKDISFEACVQDFCVINWAVEL